MPPDSHYPPTTSLRNPQIMSITSPSSPDTLAISAPDLAPPETWRDSADWRFSSFALYLTETNCTHCGSVNHASEVFRMYVRQHSAATDKRLLPATHIPPTFKVVTFNLPVKPVPLCHCCLTKDREGTQSMLVSSEQAWREALKRDQDLRNALRTPLRTTTTRASKPAPSLDELLGF